MNHTEIAFYDHPYTLEEATLNIPEPVMIICPNCGRHWNEGYFSPNEPICFQEASHCYSENRPTARRTDFSNKEKGVFIYVNVCCCGCVLNLSILMPDRIVEVKDGEIDLIED